MILKPGDIVFMKNWQHMTPYSDNTLGSDFLQSLQGNTLKLCLIPHSYLVLEWAIGVVEKSDELADDGETWETCAKVIHGSEVNCHIEHIRVLNSMNRPLWGVVIKIDKKDIPKNKLMGDV
jgi:hypothetical protein